MNRPITDGFCRMSVTAFFRTAVSVVVLLFLASPLAAETLARPAGIEADIGFWKRVFSEVSSRQALIHDNRYLSIVYEKVDLPGPADWDADKRNTDAVKGKYERALKALAAGKRDGLTEDEARVLALWPAGVTNEDLLNAAGRVRSQQGLADRFRDGLVRAGQWRDHIRESLRREGVPEELAALPHVESSFDPSARSYAGAAGLWQFTGETGRRFMRIDSVVDERRDPFESSDAAARLLKYNNSILGSWPLAITAYNHGVSGMRRAVQAMGTDDIETIVHKYDGPLFGFASRNFYVSFLAALDIDQQPDQYFGAIRAQPPRQDLLLQVPDYIRAQTLERTLGISRDTLQGLNPALLPPIWDGAKYIPRGFQLRIPTGVIEAAPEQLLAAIPKSQRFDAQRPDRTHHVRRGETFSGIAAHYGISQAQLLAANGIQGKARVRAGQVLRLPGGGEPEPATVARKDAPALPAQPPAKVAAAPSAEPPGAQTHTVGPPPAGASAAVRAGGSSSEGGSTSLADPSDYLVAKDGTIEIQTAETLSQVAEWLGSNAEQLRDLNQLSKKSGLLVGQRLKVAFDKVNRESFIERRIAYHRGMQAEFFSHYRITDTTEHRLRAGESVWVLTQQKYKVPVWLLRQYNPDLDLNQLRPGTRVRFPRLELLSGNSTDNGSVAQAL